MVEGKRPDKPENASAIGFSDSLWSFTKRCWDSEMESRPKVAEVVTHLKGAAATWNGLMPPCVRAKNSPSSSQEGSQDSMQYGEFEMLILWKPAPNESAGKRFPLRPSRLLSHIEARREFRDNTSWPPSCTSAEIPATARTQPRSMRVHRFDDGNCITFPQTLPGASAALG